MDKLQLDGDEGILLQATEVERYGEKEVTLDELILTNKNIICIYSERNGMFSKSEKRVDKIPLDSLKVINGKVQIMKVTHPEYEDVVQILLKSNRREFFAFFDRKEETRWINTINTTITGDETPLIVEEPKRKKSLFVRRTKDITDDAVQKLPARDVMESEQTDYKWETDAITSDRDSQNDVMTEVKEIDDLKFSSGDALNTVFCWKCGAMYGYGAKFCPECGISVQNKNNPKPTEEVRMEEQYQQSTSSERRQVYAGKIIKCPSCGEVINSFVAVCPSCGHELRDIDTSNLIKNFSVKIEQMTSDEQKATLIRNFPISNTKEDIFEFMILASSNVAGEHNEIVFNAWLAKFEQCYQKAVLLVANDPDFTKIQNLYEQTTKQISKERTIHRINKTGTVVSKFTAIFSNPIFGIVFILLVIWEIIRIVKGDFIGLDIIMVAIILRCVYKIKFTNRNGGTD